jgi:hypothetical protein
MEHMSQISLLLSMVLPGVLSMVSHDLLELISKGMAKVPSRYKPLVQIVMAVVITQVGELLHLTLPVDPSTWTGDTVNTLIVALAGIATHALRKLYTRKATTTPETPVTPA